MHSLTIQDEGLLVGSVLPAVGAYIRTQVVTEVIAAVLKGKTL